MAAEADRSSQSKQFLDFEKPIIDLENKIAELKQVAAVQNVSVSPPMEPNSPSRLK